MAERLADDIAAIHHRNHRRFVGLLEVVIAWLQLLPEIRIVRELMSRHVGVGHAERVDADLHAWLAKYQRAGDKLEDLVNAGIGHRVAADGNAGAVDHQVFTFIAVRAIVGIWEADIDRFIKAAVWF